jgi:maltose/moltooligosaccharide transporter
MKQKPNLTFWQLWNLSFAYLGIQIGYSLQGTQMSGIFSALGAADANLAILFIGGPLAGILVQPIIGLFSDKTWVKGLGRRIPFLLGGGILATLMMVLIVNTKVLSDTFMPSVMMAGLPIAVIWAAIFFLLKDCAFNASMHPLRALQGDMVNEEQRDKGFGVQMILLNIGQIVGFALPFLFAATIDFMGWENTKIGGLPISLSMSYYVGAAILIFGVLWTSFRVKEYPPKEFAEYNGITEEVAEKKESFWTILKTSPAVMYQLAIVQFFVWSAMFLIWNYGLNGVAQNIFGVERVMIDGAMRINTADPNFVSAQGWWGISNAVMALFALGFSFIWPNLTNKFGRKPIYSLTLLLCGLGFMSIFVITNKYVFFLPMAAWGIATAVFNAIPFAIVCAKVPKEKMGAYMGIFNLTLVIPQIIMGLIGGFIFKLVVGDVGSNALMLVVVGVLFTLAAISAALFVKDDKDIETPCCK